VEIVVSGDAHPAGALEVAAGETRRLRVASRDGARIALRARGSADAERAPAAALTGLVLEPAERP